MAEEPQWSVLVMTLPQERKGFPEEQVVVQEVAQEVVQVVAEEPQWSVLVMTLPQERKGFPEEQVVAQEVAQEVAEEPQWSVLVMTLPQERKGFPEEQVVAQEVAQEVVQVVAEEPSLVSPGHDVTPREVKIPRRTRSGPRDSTRGGRGGISSSPGHDVTPREVRRPRRDNTALYYTSETTIHWNSGRHSQNVWFAGQVLQTMHCSDRSHLCLQLRLSV